MAQSPKENEQTGSFSVPTEQTSMCSLIIWNISKALEKNPCMDLRHAMRSAHDRFDRESRDEIEMISLTPEERHLTCAVLAWQQLGHKDTDSLYQFIEQNRNKPVQQSSENSTNANINTVNNVNVSSISRKDLYREQSVCSKDVDFSSFDTKTLMGPVVRLPRETKIIMRMESTPCSHHTPKKTQKNQNAIMNKIDAACCMDSACGQRLKELDTAVCELRNRAARLARREAERVELLERAEAAWKDLELGYQRRLALSIEKVDDMAKQIEKTIHERNAYKNVCIDLAKNLKEVAEIAENERDELRLVENNLCDRACVRLRLSDDAAQGDSAVSEQLCKVSQMDRDLQLKEDQIRRKVSSLESEMHSAQCLTYEVEITLRAELGMLKEQITQVSQQLLTEESEVQQIKTRLDELKQEKEGLIEDLDGCKSACDSRMLGKINELKQKREELLQLKEKVIECRCKIPLDEAIQVKRTPSLAALCQCTSEDRLLDSCSCTSLRTQLLSTLLSDLFGGLQSELGGSGSTMPCQLLKCLDDKHNWDRCSIVKLNLRNFFEQLLVGELDIAIATSIEKYHAKWIGKSCVDRVQVMPYSAEANNFWQEKDIERRAQSLASKLAEQLFNERADQITKKAKEIMAKGPPPCQCRTQPAVYPCFVKRPNITQVARKNPETPPSYFKRTLQDVTQLRTQLEDLKKESVKKEDLRLMEGKITRIVKQASKKNSINLTNIKLKRIKDAEENINENTKKLFQYGKAVGKIISENKAICNTKHNMNKSNQNAVEIKKRKLLKNIEQSLAVNLCLCGTRNTSAQDPPQKDTCEQNLLKDKIETTDYKISQILPLKSAEIQVNQFSIKSSCPSQCVCFHKIPSNTSIEKLLDTLLNRKGDKNDNITILTKQRKENKRNDITLSVNLSDDTKQNKSTEYLPVNGKDNILLENNSLATYPCDDLPECCIDKYGPDIVTDVLPNTTDSEYIGAVNLDKSNDNSYKYPDQTYDKLKHGDGQEECIELNTSPVNQNNNVHSSNSTNMKIDFKKESQVYSVHTSRFKNVDKDLQNHNVSNKSVGISGNSYVDDVLKKSDLLPNDCDYSVKFLGVTLTNAIKTSKKIYDNDNTLSTLTNLDKDYTNSLEVKGKSQVLKKNQTNSELQCVPSKNNSGILNTLCGYDTENKGEKKSSEIINDEKTNCVCCKKDEYNDLEVNAFNLLEEHLKEKLLEFQRSTCKSERMTAEDEKILLSSILTKVKEMVSENTTQLSCKCMGLNVNEESWNRAHCLLQEYLKVKMKRVQCSCITSDSSIDNVLPAILDKVSNLIDNDFQRLKEKHNSENKNNNENLALKNIKEQTTETMNQYNDMFVQSDNNKKNNEYDKDFEDTSIQALPIHVDNKSCEVVNSNFQKYDTAEKKVSCEFKKCYVTSCKCRYTLSEPFYIDFRDSTNQSKLLEDIQFKSNTLRSLVTNNDSPPCISSILVKEQPGVPKNTDTDRPAIDRSTYIHHYSKFRSDCSSVSANLKKNVGVVNSYTTNPSKDLFFIMHRIPTTIRSEHLCINKSTGNISELKGFASSCDVAMITDNNEEEIILKYSKETCCITDISNNTSISTVTKCKRDSSNWYDCNAQPINKNEHNELDKKSLYTSMYFPPDRFTNYKKYDEGKDSTVKKLISDVCNCEMVPICHVKMLVENIEQKLVQAKCTCDSLSSRVCPIHGTEESY